LTLTTAPGVGTLSGSTSTTGSATSTQTSTGKLTATDADGDTVTYTATTGSQGGTLTINPDGSFTYTGTLSNTIRHEAAKIGATSAQMNDTFTVTANDGFGGTATYTVNVPIYALNTAPTISGGTAASLFGLSPTVTSISVYDADGDSVGGAYSGGAGYTITSGFNFIYMGNQQSLGTSSINAQSAITNYSGKTVTLTVYDGYHTVVNGVVQSSASSASKSWTF
jgi:VCBS repeat-containing protein